MNKKKEEEEEGEEKEEEADPLQARLLASVDTHQNVSTERRTARALKGR